jgi:hypothetical protein
MAAIGNAFPFVIQTAEAIIMVIVAASDAHVAALITAVTPNPA